MTSKIQNKTQKLALIFATLCLTSLPVHATDSEVLKSVIEGAGQCSNFIRADEQNVYFGFGAYKKAYEEPRSPIPAVIRVVPVATPAAAFTLQTADAAIDSVTDGGSLFVLTYSGIEEWDLASRTRKNIYNTYAYGPQMAYREHARGFARFGDEMIIAHGRLGVSFFNLKTRRLDNQFRLLNHQLPHESQAMDVTVQNGKAYVIVQSFTLPTPEYGQAFSGLVVIDMTSQKVVTELGGMDTGADAIVNDGTKAIVSFMGNPIWKYTLSSLNGSTLPEPENRVWRFPVEGHPTGKPMLDAKYYFTCFKKRSAGGQDEKWVPLALDRKALMLN